MQWEEINESFVSNDNRLHHRRVFVATGIGGRRYTIRPVGDEGFYRLYVNDAAGLDFVCHDNRLYICIFFAENNLEPCNIAEYFLALMGVSLPVDGMNARAGTISIHSERGRECMRCIDAFATAARLGDDWSNVLSGCQSVLRDLFTKYRSNELR